MLVEDILCEALSPDHQAVLKIVKTKFVELTFTLNAGKTTGVAGDPALWPYPVGRPYLYDDILSYIRTEINKMEQGKVKNWWLTYNARFRKHYGQGDYRLWKKKNSSIVAMFASRWLTFTVGAAIKTYHASKVK